VTSESEYQSEPHSVRSSIEIPEKKKTDVLCKRPYAEPLNWNFLA
jgi:hypothetical protein